MPKLDLETIPEVNRTGYPAPFDEPVAGRWQRRLAPPSGITAFGASMVRLAPGAWSSQRHWHAGEDELLVMIEGEAVLIEDQGESLLHAGDVASFAAGVANGHHLINRSERDCRFLVVGGGSALGGAYSDIDMKFTADGAYVRRDGTPYAAKRH